MKRRFLLVGAAALTALPSIPAIATPARENVSYTTDMTEWLDAIEKYPGNNSQFTQFRSLNEMIARRAGIAHFATSPVFIKDGKSVSVSARTLKVQFTLELARDLKSINGLDAEAEIRNILAEEIAKELAAYQLESGPIVLYKVDVVKAVESFAPVIGFEVWYAST